LNGAPADGSPEHAYEAYRDTVKAIRDASGDILIHPTLGYVTLNAPAEERLAHVRRMVEEGYPPDIAPMDMGHSCACRRIDRIGHCRSDR
jgi:uncharacterized protein (DUF849 family)